MPKKCTPGTVLFNIDRLSDLFEQNGWTIRQLADKLRVSASTIDAHLHQNQGCRRPIFLAYVEEFGKDIVSAVEINRRLAELWFERETGEKLDFEALETQNEITTQPVEGKDEGLSQALDVKGTELLKRKDEKPTLKTLPSKVKSELEDSKETTTQIDLTKNKFQEDSSVINILVTSFREYGEPGKASKVGTIIADYITTELRRMKEDSLLKIDVEFLLPEKLLYIENHSEALSLGDTLNADIIIWGEIDRPYYPSQEWYIKPHLTLRRGIREFDSKVDLETVRTLSPRPLSISFPKQLLARPRQLVLFLIGYSYYLKAYSSLSETEFDNAIYYFQEAVEVKTIKTDYLDVLHYYLGSAFFGKFSYCDTGFKKGVNTSLKKAEDAFNTSSSINPRNAYALNGLGAVELKQYKPDYEAAIEYFYAAIDIDPLIIPIQVNLSYLYVLHHKDYDKAINLLKKTLLHFPNLENQNYEFMVHTNLALAYLHKKDFPKAEALCTAAIDRYPKDYGNWVNLSMALHYQGKFDQEYEACLEAYKIDSNHPTVLFNLGTIFAQRKEYSKAISYIKSAFSNFTADEKIICHFHIFGIYCLQSNKGSAKYYFDRVKDHLDTPIRNLVPSESILDSILCEPLPIGSFEHQLILNPMFRNFLEPYLKGRV